MLLTAISACSRVSTPLKMIPCSPMSSACLTTHWDWSASGGNRANNATFGWRLPFLRIVALSVILQEQMEGGKIQRVVLHVGVNKIDRCPRHLARVYERQVAGVEAIDRFTLRQLCDHRVEVQRLLLRRQHGRRDEERCPKYKATSERLQHCILSLRS